MDKVVEEYKDIFTSPAGVPLHCQVKHSINLTAGASFPNAPIYWHSVLENDEIKRQFKSYCRKVTSIQVHRLMGAQSCWYRRRMGLGVFVLTIKRVHVDAAKIQVIQYWLALTTLIELRSFLGLPNFYRRFMMGFSHISWHLVQVIKGGAKAKLLWSESQQKAFTELKHCLCCTPVLTLLDFQQPFEIETDASDYSIGAILTQ
eukprot:PITA_02683